MLSWKKMHRGFRALHQLLTQDCKTKCCFVLEQNPRLACEMQVPPLHTPGTHAKVSGELIV